MGGLLGYRDGMGGTRDDDPAGGSGEIYIIAPDGPVDGGVVGPPGVPRRPGVPGRQAALLVVVGLLAFGIGVGVGTHRGDASGTSASADATLVSAGATSVAAPSPTAEGSAAPTSAGAESAAVVGGSVPRSNEPGALPSGVSPSTAALEPWPTTTGACGYEQPVPLISGTRPLAGETGLTVIAGGAPSRIRVDGGGAGEALFSMPVDALAADSAGLVAITTPDPCASNPESATLAAFRVGSDGALGQVYPAALRPQPAVEVWGIISGGDRAWLVAAPPYDPDAQTGSADDVDTLIAADGSGDSVILPAGFTPMAGWGDLIVGYYVSNAADTYGPIQIYDVTSAGIVTQIAAVSPRMVASNGHIAWVDDTCQARCTAHRYDVDTGERSDVAVTLPDSDYGGVGSLVALSPDGRRVAMITYDAAADSRYELGHPGGPARFSVLDLESGRLTTLPGLLRAPKSPFGLAFSPDAQWLAVAVNDGARTRILLYDHDLGGPYDPGISVPASTAWTIPLVVEQP